MLHSDPKAPKPRELREATVNFTDRAAFAEQVDAAVNTLAERDRPLIVVIRGLPGIGKRALARWLAKKHHTRFPGGALYVDLAREQAEPNATIGGILRRVGFPADEIPDRFADRVSLFRSWSAQEPPLLVAVERAMTASQVRALVPNSPGSLVLVTADRKLTALGRDHDLHDLVLDKLDPSAAAALLTIILGEHDPRPAAEPEEFAQLLDYCDGLPIALCVLGAMLTEFPERRLRRFAATLAEERDRLARLSGTDDDLSVPASLAAAYQNLAPAARDVYRAIGRHPRTPGFGLPVLVAATGRPRIEVEDAVDDLLRASLLDDLGDDRYSIHSLVALHARHLTADPSASPATAPSVTAPSATAPNAAAPNAATAAAGPAAAAPNAGPRAAATAAAGPNAGPAAVGPDAAGSNAGPAAVGPNAAGPHAGPHAAAPAATTPDATTPAAAGPNAGSNTASNVAGPDAAAPDAGPAAAGPNAADAHAAAHSAATAATDTASTTTTTSTSMHAPAADTAAAADTAVRDFYRAGAFAAGQAANPGRPFLREFWPDQPVRDMSKEDGLAWLAAERANLLALAQETDPDTAALLAVAVWPLLERDKYAHDLAEIIRLGVQAARALAQPDLESLLLTQYGFAHQFRGDLAEAIAQLGQAVDRAVRVDIRATALEGLALAELPAGDPHAEAHLRENLALAEAIDNPRRTALACLHLAKIAPPAEALALLDRAEAGLATEAVNRAKVRTWRGIRTAELGDQAQAVAELTAAYQTMTAENRIFDRALAAEWLGRLTRDRARLAEAQKGYWLRGSAADVGRVTALLAELGPDDEPARAQGDDQPLG